MRWISLMSLFLVAGANAASVAVIDSGLDYKHEAIIPHLWTNPLETEDRRDEDGNGYQDDVNGWNFAEQNGQVIDYKYLGTFTPDPKRYFEIQGKSFLGQATAEEKEWVKTKAKDKNFIKEIQKFGNFVHGTHVAGIAAQDSENLVMGVKLLPTEIKPFLEGLSTQKAVSADRWELLATAFDALAGQQMALLTEIAKFVDHHKMQVANGSFGTGFEQAKVISDNAFKLVFLRKPSDEESDKAANLFVNALIKKGSDFVAAAPKTVFVFAAGNDGSNNDTHASSPANVRADNVLTVAATYKNKYLAPFSNFGLKNVDVAAPGMLIRSAIPGGDYLEVSGTSQAAPFVANVAGRVFDANQSLTPLQVKTIIMSTVDKKAYLTDKVVSGGVVNTERAVTAASLAAKYSLPEAIKKAQEQVADEEVSTIKELEIPGAVTPIPLTSLFQ
jgi:cell wall-associated protease